MPEIGMSKCSFTDTTRLSNLFKFAASGNTRIRLHNEAYNESHNEIQKQ